MQKEDPAAFDVNKICRLCLQQLDNGSYIDLFTVNHPVSPLAMLIRCASIEVYEKDGFPPAICNDCYYKLGMAYEFRNRCELSDQKLREFLHIPHGSGKREPLAPATENTDPGKDDDIYVAMSEIFGPDESNLGVEPATNSLTVSHLVYETEQDTVKNVLPKVSKGKQQIKRKSQLDELLVKHKEKLWLESTKVKLFRQKRTDRKQGPGRRGWVAPKETEQGLTRGKTFNSSGYLKAHPRSHVADKPLECDICKRRFGNSNNLRLHMRIHSSEKRFQCEVCSKLFRTSSNLHAHLKTHSESRNHTCRMCEKAFRTMRELTNHSKTHSAVKNYVCRACSKAFVKQSYLTTHMNTVHVGLKRHRCQECGKQFSNSSNLIAHRRVHTGEKPYQCTECDSKFNQSSALSRHIRQQHRPRKDPSPGPLQPSVSRASEAEELTIEVDENRSLESTASSELSVATSLMDNQPITYGGLPYAQTFVPQHPPQPQHFSHTAYQHHHPHHHHQLHHHHAHHHPHPHHHHHSHHQQQHHQPHSQAPLGHQSIAVNQQMAGANLYSTEYLPPYPATQQTHYDLGGYDMCYSMPASTVLNPSLMNPQPTYIFDQ